MSNWKIDPHTNKQWKSIIIGLHDLIYNGKDVINSLPDFEYAKDLGVIDYTGIGEARKIEVSYNGITYVFYIHFYNRDNGNCLAVTNEANGRNLLQLVLDNYIENTPFGVRLWHDGIITGVANLTSKKLLNYVKERRPDLIKNEEGYGDYVEFGFINEDEKLSFSNSKTLQLLSNLLLYSILRNDIKKDFKEEDIEQSENESNKSFLLVNITWNSNNWQEPSEDKSGHKYVTSGNVPHESWNFDFDNPRNNKEFIYGFGQFTNPPRVEGNGNLLIFYSQNQIVGFYGKAVVLPDPINLNKRESYNLVGYRPLCVLLKNKLTNVKEKGYLEEKQRVGQIGFTYLESTTTIENIINEAISLNPEEKESLEAIKEWIVKGYSSEQIKEMFTAYLTEKGPESSDKYISSIEGKVSEWCRKHKFVGETVYEKYLPNEVDEMFNKLENLEDIKVNKNTFFTPMNWYRDFCNDLSAGTIHKKQQNLNNSNNMATNNVNPHNQILFGPPGTGKTFHTINEAVKIINPDYYELNKNNRDKLREEYNNNLIIDWEATKGQIGFCTFHQSFSYEDFVEGIKPVEPKDGDTYLKYKIQEGIFKKICRLAEDNIKSQSRKTGHLISLTDAEYDQAKFYKISLGDINDPADQEIYDYCMEKGLVALGFGEGIDFTGKDEYGVTEAYNDKFNDGYGAQAINYFKNYLKIGNYIVVSKGNHYIRALGKITGDYFFDPNTPIRYKQFRKVEWIFKDQEIPVQDLYEKNLSQQSIYKLKSDWIKRDFFVKTKTTISETQNKPKNFVLVIDEINRGNVASIFGELITLIEKDKRASNAEALEVVLPYSKDRFTVPPNLYIIGTMNTADRSIEALDTALRRRFSFREMPPKSELIKTEGALKPTGKIGSIDVISLLDKINERVEKLIDKDHKIGHSYFMPISTKDQLIEAFKDKVIPLLEEYFFGDFGKIGLVLGDSFLEKVESDNFDFASFKGYDNQVTQDLTERPVYKIKFSDQWDFESIYKTKKVI